MNVKTRLQKLLNHTKSQKETINRTCSELSFFAIFCEFNKQNMLANNDIIQTKKGKRLRERKDTI